MPAGRAVRLATGKTAVRFYTGPEDAAAAIKPHTDEPEPLQEGETFAPAEPIQPLVLPKYPEIPATERSRWVTVGVHLGIDRFGMVADVTPSVVCITTPDPHLEAFRRAVEAAVQQWHFRPAQSLHMEKATGTDGTTWWRVSQREPVASSTDVSFTFTASGRVKPN